ncbi:UNVERIFIED_CONTAM: D-alanyl-D-alanine carboxypeptidase/D-alanyl-D-alanine carboxypeptidase (penicillin-binding protein 5/6) [Acetivibrio alkalicellulosi]
MKKLFLFITLILILISGSSPINAQNLNIHARAYILIDSKTGQVLREYNSNAVLHPASTTKIMTGILAIEYGDLDSIVTVSQSAINNIGTGGMHIGLLPGEQLELRHILNALLIRSANEACYVVAENISDTHQEFFDLMNQRAKELGAVNTNFVNPSGMDNTSNGHLHVTSASDLAIMARHAMTLPEFREVVAKTSYTIPPTNMHENEILLPASNRLLFSSHRSEYYTATGIKTGYTNRALSNLVSSGINDDGMELIAVVMGVEKYDQVFHHSKRLLEYGFKNYSMRSIIAQNSYIATVKVDGASGNHNLDLLAADSFMCALPNGMKLNELTFEKVINDNITAPVYKGDVLGYVEIKNNDYHLGKVDLVATRSVPKFIPVEDISSIVLNPLTDPLLKRVLIGTSIFFFMFLLLRRTLRKISRTRLSRNKL